MAFFIYLIKIILVIFVIYNCTINIVLFLYNYKITYNICFMENTYNKIIENLKLFFQNAGFDKAVIGLSGGMDSGISSSSGCRSIGY